jgi:hypothetical protein
MRDWFAAVLAALVIATLAGGITAVIVLASVPKPNLVGDDNGDGVVEETETGWDCASMGNRTCGVWRI